MGFSILTVVQPLTQSNFRTFLLLQEKTLYPLAVNPYSPLVLTTTHYVLFLYVYI